MSNLKTVQTCPKETIKQKCLPHKCSGKSSYNSLLSDNQNDNKTMGKALIYLSYGMIAILLTTIASESFAVDLNKFGRGVTEPMVKFASDYWVYGAGIGGIATALLSEGDGRVRIIRGGTVFLGSSAICMGILAALT